MEVLLSSVKLHYANISLIVYSEMITFPCMNLICYLCIMITNHYHMYLIVKTHFVLCLLLSNGKFNIHSDGSLEYEINKINTRHLDVSWTPHFC
jgi:hypothetical protein